MGHFLGVDPAKQKISARLFTNKSRLDEVEVLDIPNDEAIFSGHVDKLKLYPNLIVCAEESTNYGERYINRLKMEGFTVFHVPPIYTSERKKKNPHPTKNDGLDCKYIVQAYLLESKNIQQLHLNLDSEYYKELNSLSKARWQLGLQKSDLKKQLNFKLYKMLGANYKKCFVNRFWTVGLIKEIIKTYSNERGVDADIVKSYAIDLLINNIRSIKLDKLLNTIKNQEVKALISIKGVGILTASRLVSIIRLGKPLRSRHSLKKWAGLSPVEFSSGNKITHKRDTRGRPELKCIFHIIVNTRLRGCKDYMLKHKEKIKVAMQIYKLLRDVKRN